MRHGPARRDPERDAHIAGQIFIADEPLFVARNQLLFVPTHAMKDEDRLRNVTDAADTRAHDEDAVRVIGLSFP